VTSRLPQRALVLSLGLASIAGFSLAALPGPRANQSGADNLAAGDSLTPTPTPTLDLNPTPNLPEYKSRSKIDDPPCTRDSTAVAHGPVIDRLIDFQQYRFGVPPPEFDYDVAGPSGKPSVLGRPSWRTYVDLSAPSPKLVLIQWSTQSRAAGHSIAVLRDATAENVNLAVSFKLLAGDTARSAGLLWRAQSTNDYRSVLVCALHREIRLLKMERGRAVELAKATATINQQDWNFLELSVQGERIVVWLNERSVLETRDAMTAQPGRVGLITDGETVALFDDFQVQTGRSRVVRQSRPIPALPPAPILHATDIFATHSDFKAPRRSFRPGDQIRWRVHVADEHEQPRPASIVGCELVSPDGNVFGHDKAMTGTDGAALFTRALPTNAALGAYTVRVSDITHADLPEATYSSRVNLKSAVPFEVRP
jgi:hypothetical protein